MTNGSAGGPGLDTSLDPSHIRWIERTPRGHVVSARRTDRWRPHYAVDVAVDGVEVPMTLKGPRTPRRVEARSEMLSRFGTRRERRYRRPPLTGTPRPAPVAPRPRSGVIRPRPTGKTQEAACEPHQA